MQTHVGGAVLPAVAAAPDHLEDGPVCQLNVGGVRAEHALADTGRAQTAAERQRPHPGAARHPLEQARDQSQLVLETQQLRLVRFVKWQATMLLFIAEF